MPLHPSLATPGSPIRLLCLVPRLSFSLSQRHNLLTAPASFNHGSFDGTETVRHIRRKYCSSSTSQTHLHKETEGDSVATDLSPFKSRDARGSRQPLSQGEETIRFVPAEGSMKRKRRRTSRPTAVLNSIHTSERTLYLHPGAGKNRLSASGSKYVPPNSLPSILARYLDQCTGSDDAASGFSFTAPESELLSKNGFNEASVVQWATCLLERKSRTAVALFISGDEVPPLFILLLFLRRQYISAPALDVILRHIDERYKEKPPPWSTLQLLCVRMVRHARQHKPESIPWIASFFAAQAGALFGETDFSKASPRLLSDLTRFCNSFLFQISLPVSLNPLLAALDQEKAQFHVLQFLASCTPAITVTRVGFRSVAQNQLAHPKTDEEKDWAELKGSSWPPWKENRTAMDEDKGYEFGASRASRILHRMHEAGYSGQKTEAIMEVYAGWDTDLSPTIQTRTSLPLHSSRPQHADHLTSLLWASRVRTTRTRREAWACFLAYEMSGASASQQVYLAMFEKLHYSAMRRSSSKKPKDDLGDNTAADVFFEDTEMGLLPGDMKEVLPDPTSPLHYVYLSEPVPTIKELYYRLISQDVQPSGRLLAFLLARSPSLETCLKLLEDARHDFNGGVGHLLSGQLDNRSCIRAVPNYLLAAFIQFLCRFGQFARPRSEDAVLLPPEEHAHALKHSPHYLMEYAYILLHRYKPLYRPAWAAYIHKVVHSNLESTIYNSGEDTTLRRGMVRYNRVWMLVKLMENNDLDVDDRIFQMLCKLTTSAAQATQADPHLARHISTIGIKDLRKVFAGLVGATASNISKAKPTDSAAPNTVPPHIPGPSDLHAYVRALGTARDYEGLYSFSTWLATHHVEVTARSGAQHSGNKSLFRTLVALRAAVTGSLGDCNEPHQEAPDEIVQLIRSQIDSVEEWGGWPAQEYVDQYARGALRSGLPSVKGR
ncbi:hypothetical protein DE146DRAFT_765574 [Phaeosphaeria sp. MPI-PUGE-AT-0046c]|nr:hypothetical protein DE146DRAFT_765574 [Phaeosphaeria sp. MPI-PUGE-AT-0046c]